VSLSQRDSKALAALLEHGNLSADGAVQAPIHAVGALSGLSSGTWKRALRSLAGLGRLLVTKAGERRPASYRVVAHGGPAVAQSGRGVAHVGGRGVLGTQDTTTNTDVSTLEEESKTVDVSRSSPEWPSVAQASGPAWPTELLTTFARLLVAEWLSAVGRHGAAPLAAAGIPGPVAPPVEPECHDEAATKRGPLWALKGSALGDAVRDLLEPYPDPRGQDWTRCTLWPSHVVERALCHAWLLEIRGKLQDGSNRARPFWGALKRCEESYDPDDPRWESGSECGLSWTLSLVRKRDDEAAARTAGATRLAMERKAQHEARMAGRARPVDYASMSLDQFKASRAQGAS
jgi:hypothetical protein